MAVGVEIATAYVSIVPSFRGLKEALRKAIAGGLGGVDAQMEKKLGEASKKAATRAGKEATKALESELRPWVRKMGTAFQNTFSNIGAGFAKLDLAKRLGLNLAKNQLDEFSVSSTQASGRVRSALNNIGTAIGNVGKSFSQSTPAAEGFVFRMAAGIGRADDAIVNFAKNTATKFNTGIGSAFQNVNKKMADMIGLSESTATKFGNFTKSAVGGLALTAAGTSALGVAAVGAAAAITGIGLAIAGINRLNTIQQSSVAFEVMLGSAEKAKAVMADLTTFAKTTPFPLDSITDAAKTLKAMGQDTEKLVPTLRAAGNAAAALGTGTQGMKDISFIMGQIITKGKLEGDELVQLAERGVNASAILGNKLGVKATEAGAKIKDMGISAKKAVDMIVEGIEEGTDGVNGSTAKMGGMLEKFKNTWEGRWTDMKAAFSRLGATIFEPLFVGGQSAMAGLTVLMDKFGEKWKVFVQAFQSSGLGGAIRNIVTAIGELFSSLTPEREKGLKDLSDQIMPALRMSINAVADAIEALARWFKENEFIAKALGYALIGLVIGLFLLVAAVVIVIVLIEAMAAAIAVLAGAIVYVLYSAIVWLKDNLGGVLEGIYQLFVTLLKDVWQLFVDFGTLIWETVKFVFDFIIAILVTAFATMGTIIETFFYLVTGQWSKIGDSWSTLGGLLTRVWGNVWDDVLGMATSAVNFLVSLINGAIHQINGLISAINSIPGVNIGSIPDIPRLATGGIAMGATTAIVGEGSEPEAIMPLSKLENFINSNPARNSETQIVINAAGADRQFLTFLRSMVRTQGGGNVQKAFGV